MSLDKKKWPQHPDGTEIIKIEIRFGLSIPENSYNGILFEHIDGHNGLISRLVQYIFCMSLIHLVTIDAGYAVLQTLTKHKCVCMT